jgi:hypothetical protein
LGLPRYTHQALSRALKNTPYQTFINAYPRNTEQLHKVMEENRQLFASVGVIAFVRVSHPHLLMFLFLALGKKLWIDRPGGPSRTSVDVEKVDGDVSHAWYCRYRKSDQGRV